MDTELLNRLGELCIYAWYDTSKEMLTVHFINEEVHKPDLMAYLLFNKSWDVREVVGETARLEDDREVIEIQHNRIGIFEKDSSFDQMVRKAVREMAKNEENVEKEESLTEVIKNLFDD
jgi:putative ubiquitin-RnfH superfamily antitoxin RatB of RatAB toxin-antitoxin module